MVRFKPIQILRWLLLIGGLIISLNFLLESGQTSKENMFMSNQVRDTKSLPENPEITIHKNNVNQNKNNINKFIQNESNTKRPQDIQSDGKISFNSDAYLVELTSLRIERLFKILLEKEKNFTELMNRLGLVMFENLVDDKQDSSFKGYENERDLFLKVVDNRVRVTNSFMNYLFNLSEFYSFKNPRNHIKRSTFKGVSKFSFLKNPCQFLFKKT